MNFTGLKASEVDESRKKYGSNVIKESEPTTFWDEFKETFSDPMIKILLVVACIMFVMFFTGYAEIYEPIGTVVAILIVAVVSAKTGVANDQAYRKTKASIKKDLIKTIRDDELTETVIDDLVVGDLIVLQSGDKVPADCVIVDGHIKINNAALNGESEDCKKNPIALASVEDYIASFPSEPTGESFVDQTSLFRGAIVTDGECKAIISKVGMETMMGKMAEEMDSDDVDSPLRVKLDKLAHQISVFGYVGAVVIAVCMMIFKVVSAGSLNDYMFIGLDGMFKDLLDAISLAVVIIVCAVPEGLPLMISLVLMQNTKKMLDHNVLVRKSIGIETAGSLNILFSDKTGTITKGELEVVEYFSADGVVSDIIPEDLKWSIARNTQSAFDKDGNIVGGNFTDKALLKFIGVDTFNELVHNGVVEVATQGFNSANKFSQTQINGKTYYKGAPERLLAKATKYVDQSGVVKSIDMNVLNAKIDEMADRSMRILAFGYSEKALVENEINDDLVIIGLVGIRDDVRPDAKKAIQEITKAGIQLVMITGDRLETARAIAKDAGLITSETDVVLSSTELNQMSDDEVKKVLPNIRVIARALPTDKSRMVRLSQELNLVAGMTGDGINDAPALKRADVGFSMGSGTDGAKEASDIVILDDSLMSIADAIWYGRTIYHNILKFVNFQLVINVCAVVISALAPFFGVDEPLKVTHLLFVNLVMDSLGALMLGNEPALEKYMLEKPRRRDESIISGAMAKRIGVEALWAVILSFAYLKLPFFTTLFDTSEQHLTGYFVMFILIALFNGFNVRDTRFGIFKGLNENKNFVRILVVIALIQAVLVYAGVVPFLGFLGQMFSCVPINPINYLLIAVLSATIIPVDLLRKAIMEKE